MFYDVEDPNAFCKNIHKLLDKNGIWVLEFSYFPLLLKNLTYDQICHEHVMYYTLNTFNEIIKKNSLKIIDFSLNEINGGSIEVICTKKNSSLKVKTQKLLNTISKETRHTPLSSATAYGLSNIVKLLLSKGAKKNIKNKDNMTALDVAKWNNYKSIENMLQ